LGFFFCFGGFGFFFFLGGFLVWLVVGFFFFFCFFFFVFFFFFFLFFFFVFFWGGVLGFGCWGGWFFFFGGGLSSPVKDRREQFFPPFSFFCSLSAQLAFPSCQQFTISAAPAFPYCCCDLSLSARSALFLAPDPPFPARSFRPLCPSSSPYGDKGSRTFLFFFPPYLTFPSPR